MTCGSLFLGIYALENLVLCYNSLHRSEVVNVQWHVGGRLFLDLKNGAANHSILCFFYNVLGWSGIKLTVVYFMCPILVPELLMIYLLPQHWIVYYLISISNSFFAIFAMAVSEPMLHLQAQTKCCLGGNQFHGLETRFINNNISPTNMEK